MKIEVEFLRLQPPTFAIIPETLAPHLEMVRYDKRFHSSNLFDFAKSPFALLTRVQ